MATLPTPGVTEDWGDDLNAYIEHVEVPTGGGPRQVLAKASTGDRDVEWVDLPSDVGIPLLSPDAPIVATKAAGNPVLTEAGSMPENIIKVDGTYWLLYSRRVAGSYTRLHLASADSPAGPWTPYSGNPVLTTGDQAWETANLTNGGCLLEHDGTFYIFYSDAPGTTGSIGVATASSVTGPYTKHAGNPIVTVGAAGAWDSLRVQEPDVIVVDGVWVMAYMAETTAAAQGTTEKIGIATAPGPFGPWTKSANNPVIGFGDAGTWDQGGAADPSLFYERGRYWCLYSGLNTNGGKPWQLGLAYADTPDGPWTRHQSNPVVKVGAAGAFDQLAVWRGAIFRDGDTYHLPYGGIPASNQSYDALGGHATLAGVTPEGLTQTEADARYVRSVNGEPADTTGDVRLTSTTAHLPLTTVVNGTPELVWGANDSLIATEVPL